jgi:hypothetical protein
MVNNLTNTNSHLLPQINTHKNDQTTTYDVENS